MKFHSLRSILARLTTLGLALLLTSCGGGGAGGNPNAGGGILLSPATGTFYAGVPSRLTMSGGRKPYALTSSEPNTLPVPAIVNDNFVDVIPNNPGVIDIGLDVGALPVRTVTLTVRDTTGQSATADIKVGQNFLTGYGLTLTPTNCPATTNAVGATACAGGTTIARMQATFNGVLTGNRAFRFEAVRGNFSLRNPVTGAAGVSITVTSDHTGTVVGLIEVPAGVDTQLATIRVTDVATGVYADQVFVISSSGANQGRVVAIPTAVKFVGPDSATCGTGVADILLYDGKPPYTGTSTNPNIIVSGSPSNTQPGTIRIAAVNPFFCVDFPVVFTDSTGGRTTVQVTTSLGTLAPAKPPDLAVSPTSFTLVCGSSGSASVVGGTGSYSVSSSNPNVTAFVSGNTVTVVRNTPDIPGSGGVPGGTSTVNVSDGTKIIAITVTSPVTCP